MPVDDRSRPDPMDTLSSIEFTPSSGDEAFLGAVKRRVRLRRRRRAATIAVSSGLGAVLLLLTVLHGPSLLRGGMNLDILRGNDLAMTVIQSEDELEQELENLFAEVGVGVDEDASVSAYGDDLTTLFEYGESADPVGILAQYDSEITDAMLDRLVDLDLPALGSSPRGSERGES